jgi:DNA topoisomerase-1
LVRLVHQCQELPGQQLFQYRNAAGELQAVRSSDVNDYLRAVSGENFTAKDFRTWGGTVAAAKALCEVAPSADPKERKTALRQALKAAAERLGNTVTVCRQYYVHPAILAEYEAGRLCAHIDKASAAHQEEPLGLDAGEAAVYAILKRASGQEKKPAKSDSAHLRPPHSLCSSRS